MRMGQTCYGTGLLQKILQICIAQMGIQHFDSRLDAQVLMFCEKDLGKTAFSQKTDEAVISKLLSNPLQDQSPTIGPTSRG